MSAAVLNNVASARSMRLLADVHAFDERAPGQRAPALTRLEAALGRDFADRLVTALSQERDERQRQA